MRAVADHGLLLHGPVARDFEAVTLKNHDLTGRSIAHQHHLAHAEIAQDLGPDTIFDQPLLTRAVGALLAFEARGDGVRSALADQHDHAAAFLADDVHGLVHQGVAVAAGGEHVIERVYRMHTHEHRAAALHVALDERHMLRRINRRGIDPEIEDPA